MNNENFWSLLVIIGATGAIAGVVLESLHLAFASGIVFGISLSTLSYLVSYYKKWGQFR